MKVKRFKYGYRKTSSALHKKVGDCLRASALSGFQILQEYPVNKVNPSFSSGREKFDWVILDLHIVIEVHGEQHFHPVTFGGISEREAALRFQEQVKRDLAKCTAAVDAGWTYLFIPYTDKDKVSEVYILDLIGRNSNNEKLIEPTRTSTVDYKKLYQEKRDRDISSGRAILTRERARLASREQRARSKAWATKRKEGKNED